MYKVPYCDSQVRTDKGRYFHWSKTRPSSSQGLEDQQGDCSLTAAKSYRHHRSLGTNKFPEKPKETMNTVTEP